MHPAPTIRPTQCETQKDAGCRPASSVVQSSAAQRGDLALEEVTNHLRC